MPAVSDRYESATLAGISNHGEPFDPHRLRRFPIQLSDGFRWFAGRLRGGFRLEEALRRRRNRYTRPLSRLGIRSSGSGSACAPLSGLTAR